MASRFRGLVWSKGTWVRDGDVAKRSKAGVCKTSIRGFESHRRLHILRYETPLFSTFLSSSATVYAYTHAYTGRFSGEFLGSISTGEPLNMLFSQAKDMKGANS